MNEEFRIYHVARNAARHNSALDDELYGTPEPSVGERDWTLDNPKKYLDDINAELPKVDRAIDDLIYILKEKNLLSKEFFGDLQAKNIIDTTGRRVALRAINSATKNCQFKLPSLTVANAHAYHAFTVRQFEYAEKLSQMLQTQTPNEIPVIQSKAERQLKVLVAAYRDLTSTYVRYYEYLNPKNSQE